MAPPKRGDAQDQRFPIAVRRDWAFLGALFLVTGLLLLDVILGPRVSLISTLIAAPFLASALTTARRTAIVCAVTLISGLLSSFVINGSPTSSVAVGVRLAVLTFSCLAAPFVARERQRRETKLVAVSRVARIAQSTILRDLPVSVAGLPVVARYRSADAESRLGGDLYEVSEWQGGLRLLVGDVRGKGLHAVRVAARAVAAFREAADTHPSLTGVVRRVDERTTSELREEDFVTAVFAEMTANGLLRIANCGHIPPVLVRPDGTWQELLPEEFTTPLGLGPDPVLTEYVIPRGGRLLFFSDGLIEARNQDGDFFPLANYVSGVAEGDLAAGVNRLLGDLDRFAASLADDLVVLAFERPSAVSLPLVAGDDLLMNRGPTPSPSPDRDAAAAVRRLPSPRREPG